MNFFYKIYYFILKIFTKIKFKPKIYGQENIPSQGRLIIISNHKSNYDFLSMGIVQKRPIHFLVKHTLFKGPLKPILKSIEAIPVDRTSKNPKVIQKAKEYLIQEEVVGIFPEGTTNKTKKTILDFKIGAIKLAYETNTPILPITILGRYKRNRLFIKINKLFYVTSSNLEQENIRLKEYVIASLRGIK